MSASGASSLSDPAGTVSYLEGISPEMRGCAILDGDGDVLAASGDSADAWREPALELIGAADSATGEAASHVHVATGDGEVFCVRQSGLAAIAVTERFALSSLMVFDLRTALRELAAGSS